MRLVSVIGLLTAAAMAGCGGRSALPLGLATDSGPAGCVCQLEAGAGAQGGAPNSASSGAGGVSGDGSVPCVASLNSTIPASGAHGVPTSTDISAIVSCGSRPVDPSAWTIRLSARGHAIAGHQRWSQVAGTRPVLAFVPDDPLVLGVPYTAEVASGTARGTFDWTFTTRDGTWSRVDLVGSASTADLALNRLGQGLIAFGGSPNDKLSVSARRFDLTGGLSPKIDAVRAADARDLHDLRTGYDDSGAALVGWVEYGMVNNMGANEVWDNRSPVEGQWSGATRLTTQRGSDNLYAAELRGDGSGLIVRAERVTGSAFPLLAQEVSRDAIGEPSVVAPDAYALGASAALGSDGSAWVAWATMNSVAARERTKSGTWAPADTASAASPKTPCIANSSDGSAIATWVEAVSDSTTVHGDGRARRYTVASGWDSAQTLATRGTKGSTDTLALQVQMDGYGDGLALWITRMTYPVQQTPSSTTYATDYELRSQTFDAVSGWSAKHARVDADSEPSTTSESLSLHSLALDRLGNALAVWSKAGSVRAARFIAESGWQPSVSLESSTDSSPAVAVDRSGRAIAIWRVNSEIHVARFLESN